jgi:HSP20 family protein
MINTSFNNVFDRMLTRALEEAPGTRRWNGAASDGAGQWLPPLDIRETADAYVVDLDLPGVEADSVEVSFEQGMLVVNGQRPTPRQENAERYFLIERPTGGFARSIRLPERVDSDRITARYANGVLSISVAKAESAKPRKIEIERAPETKHAEGKHLNA